MMGAVTRWQISGALPVGWQMRAPDRARIDRPESLCPHFHFGPRVTEAMRRWYRFEGYVGGYAVFRPVPTALARSSLTQGQVQVQPVRGAPQSCRDTGVAGAGGT